LVNGADISYLEEGKHVAAPLVFVHGSLQDFRSWRFQIEPFASRFHIITYSRRNHYPNEWSDYPSNYSLTTEGGDLVELLKELNPTISPVHLVGSSYGAFICLVVARDYPRSVRSLVVSEPPILSLLSSKDPDFYDRSKQTYEQNVADPLRKGRFELAVRNFVDSSEGVGTFDRLPEMVRSMMLENVRSLLLEDPKPERDPFSCSDASRIKQPTLLIQGANSPIMYTTINEELKQCLPDCSKVVIQSASHSLHNQNPIEYNSVALRFLSNH
jgi:non-heme chloroperoxidase